MSRRVGLFLLLLVSCSFLSYTIEAVDLQQIRATSSVGKTRIVFDVTGPLEPNLDVVEKEKQSFRLTLPKAKNQIHDGIQYSGSHGVLKGIELMEKSNGSLDVLIKANQDVKSHAFSLTNPHRVVVDLFADVTQRTNRTVKEGLEYTRLQKPSDVGLVKAYILTAKGTEPVRIGYAGAEGKRLSAVETPVSAAIGLLGRHVKQNGPSKLSPETIIREESQIQSSSILRYQRSQGYSIKVESPPLVLRTNGREYALQSVNKDRSSNSLVLYTPSYGASTRTNVYGQEMVIKNGRIVKFNKYDTPIKGGEFIVSAHGTSVDILKDLTVGMAAQIVVPTQMATVTLDNAVQYEGGSPILMNGFYMGPKESTRKGRTFLGTTTDGSLLAVSVPQEGIESMGITLAEGAQLLRSLGARNAIELQNQGAVDMLVDKKIVFSEEKGEKLYTHILVFI